MAGEAQIGLTGFVQKDPDIRFMNGGDAVASLTVKVTPFKRGPEGGKRGEPSWYRVSVWGKQAEAVADRVKEGDRVTVTGTLEMRSYEKDGEKRTVPEVRAESIGIVPKIENPTKAAAPTGSEREPW
jgi:single-strand DNA-binding protein